MSNNMNIYKELMTVSHEIAMATAKNNAPNVRVVSFAWDEKLPNTIYITTDANSNKIKESQANNNVAFVTLENKGENSRSVRAQGATIKESSRNKEELKKIFVDKMPYFAEIFEIYAPDPSFYEIKFSSVELMISMDEPQILKF